MEKNVKENWFRRKKDDRFINFLVTLKAGTCWNESYGNVGNAHKTIKWKCEHAKNYSNISGKINHNNLVEIIDFRM